MPSRRGTRRIPALLGATLLAALLVPVSCADQAEGERCDLRNGNTDCSSGLECTSDLGTPPIPEDKNAGLCCPPATQAPSVEACNRSSNSSPVVDGGTPDGASQKDATPAEAGNPDASQADASQADGASPSDGATSG